MIAKGSDVLRTDGNDDHSDGTGVQTVAARTPTGFTVLVILNKITTPCTPPLTVNIQLESGGYGRRQLGHHARVMNEAR